MKNTPPTPTSLIAIDFETADYQPDSACAVGLARVENLEVVDTWYGLIRPPRKRFYFTYVHGITWHDVSGAPTFQDLWPEISQFCHAATHFVAHNASFDRRVLHACCQAAGLEIPPQDFTCTLQASRRVLKLPSHTLSAVCNHCNIDLDHHHAGSDALAAAKLWIHLTKMQQAV